MEMLKGVVQRTLSVGRPLLSVVMAGVLAGCATAEHIAEPVNAYLHAYRGGQNIDTGVVDYRLYSESTGEGSFKFHFIPASCMKQATDGAKSGAPGSPANQCNGVQVDPRQILKAGDSVSVNILHAYICDFAEWAETPRELWRGYYGPRRRAGESTPCVNIPENRAGTRGEIAVLATAFELGGDKKITFDRDDSQQKAARVVYYSDDVREAGQPLNFSNLPIYGPVTYGGKPFFLRLYIVELDGAEVQASGSILRSLARLGASSYPPASPVLSALTKVGDAFLESQQDDTLWQYDLVLDGEGGEGVVSAPLATGIAVFVRMQDRNKSFPWDQYCVQLSTGKLFKKSNKPGASGKGDSQEVNGECGEAVAVEGSKSPADQDEGFTYITVQVKRNESALDHDVFQTFQEFSGTGGPSTGSTDHLASALDGLKEDVERASRFDKARTLLPGLKSSSPAQLREARQAFLDAVCMKSAAAADSPYLMTDEQVFYLMKRAEEDGKVEVDVAALRTDGTCDSFNKSKAIPESAFGAIPAKVSGTSKESAGP